VRAAAAADAALAVHGIDADPACSSLCALLRPLPSTFGATALNVLGKLGGESHT
jgi:hypothetical protein